MLLEQESCHKKKSNHDFVEKKRQPHVLFFQHNKETQKIIFRKNSKNSNNKSWVPSKQNIRTKRVENEKESKGKKKCWLKKNIELTNDYENSIKISETPISNNTHLSTQPLVPLRPASDKKKTDLVFFQNEEQVVPENKRFFEEIKNYDNLTKNEQQEIIRDYEHQKRQDDFSEELFINYWNKSLDLQREFSL